MKPSLPDFATFITVARHKNFRAAGDELGLSPSAVSHSVKQLELRLKIRLFNRTTRSVSLTEAGITLFERLCPAIDEIYNALDEINSFRASPMGTLKINSASLPARLFLMPSIVGFAKTYPDIKVELTTDDKLIDIVKDGFDAGVRLHRTVEKDMIAVSIGPEVKIAVVATPGYFSHHPVPTHPNDLVEHQCIVFRYPSGRPYHWEFSSMDEKLEIVPTGNIVVDDLDSELEAVLHGAGIGYLYYEQVKEWVEKGSLVSVLKTWLPERPKFQLYYPNRQYMSRPLRAFVDYIQEKT
jgi:DNA-binding transcriptional LysR family regulator